MFTKILVGIDGSELSEKALRLACDLAQKYGAELHLLHTPQPQTVAFAMGAVSGFHAVTTMPSAAEVTAAAKKVLTDGAAIAAQCGQDVAQQFHEVGDPADNMIAYADRWDIDLIVTGRRGLGAVGAMVLGSTTQRVNHLAKCACLSVA